MTSTHPPAAAGAHDDGEVKSIKYFGVAITPGDAREIAEIEAWDDETLQGIQDCRSPHDQYIISLVRQKKTYDKDREVREAVAVAARAAVGGCSARARREGARAFREEERRSHARAACDTLVGGKKETGRDRESKDAIPWRAGGEATPSSDAATGG